MPGKRNFAVIKEWNKSDVYSRTVAEFARKLRRLSTMAIFSREGIRFARQNSPTGK